MKSRGLFFTESLLIMTLLFERIQTWEGPVAMCPADGEPEITLQIGAARPVSGSLADLLQRLKNGDDSAASLILERYEAQVRLVVRRCLPRVLRSRFDSQDIMQSVWRSFFQRLRGEVVEDDHGVSQPAPGDPSLVFGDSSQLFSFLSRMAKNKVIDQYRRETSQKADIHRECTISDEHGHAMDPPSHAETPEDLVTAADELSHWRTLLPQNRRVLLDMKAHGLSSKEIGDQLGISERTVQRVLEDLRHRLELRRKNEETAESA
jgi:RNA polymerase sigma-70 factor (ECF subfamily)